MDVARQLFVMACSDNDKEALAAARVLKKMKTDFMRDPVLRKFVIRAAEAVNADNIEAYHGGATQITMNRPSGGAPSAGGPAGTT